MRRAKGRQRLNLEAALCLDNCDCQLVKSLKITAETAIALLAELERHDPGKRRIHVILDNASTHRAGPVKQWLQRPGCRIKLHFLPAHAPNLNAIEPLWNVMLENRKLPI